MAALRGSDWFAVGYFAYLAIAAGVAPHTAGRTAARRRPTAIGASGAILLIVLVAWIDPTTKMLVAIRDWAPAVYLLLGYWLPAGISAAPDSAIDARFAASDRMLYGLWPAGSLDVFNRPAARIGVEIVYPLVHLMVPAGFALIRYWLAPAAADRFWLSVLAAGFVCYGTLPWLHLRPPRRSTLEMASPPSRASSPVHGDLRRFNEWLLETTSVGASTFPSGHVATALAASLMVTTFSLTAGAPLLLLTTLIAIATIAGRYHYAVDALAGLVAGASGWLVGRLLI